MTAPLPRRLAAGAVDAVVGLLLAAALAPSAGRWCAGRAAVLLRVDDPASPWKGPLPLALGIAGDVVYGAPLALLLVLLAGPLLGRTAGALATGVRVAGPAGAEPGAGRRWRRFLLATAPWWAWNAALLTGSAALALAAAALAVVLGAGLLPALRGSRTLHDRLAGTTVVREGEAAGAAEL